MIVGWNRRFLQFSKRFAEQPFPQGCRCKLCLNMKTTLVQSLVTNCSVPLSCQQIVWVGTCLKISLSQKKFEFLGFYLKPYAEKKIGLTGKCSWKMQLADHVLETPKAVPGHPPPALWSPAGIVPNDNDEVSKSSTCSPKNFSLCKK